MTKAKVEKPKVEKPKEKEKEVKTSAVDVLDPNGDYIRTFSKKDHGDGFKELAKEFAGKVEGRKVVLGKKEVKQEKTEPVEDEGKVGEKELPEEGEVE